MIPVLTQDLWRYAALALGGACLSLMLWIFGLPVIGGGLLAKVDRLTELNAANVAAHRQTKENYRNAMAEALLREWNRLARVNAEQERINDRAKENFDNRLAALRARYDSLRGQSGKAVGSASGAEPVPGLPSPAFGADAAPGEDGFSLSERYECSVNALQLDELITWVEDQTKVKVND